MAMARRIKVTHEDVFPHGAYLVSEVQQVVDKVKLWAGGHRRLLH